MTSQNKFNIALLVLIALLFIGMLGEDDKLSRQVTELQRKVAILEAR